MAIGSIQTPCHITHQKLHYLPYEDTQAESTYTLSDLARDNAELVLVDVFRDRYFPQPIFESFNWKVSDDPVAMQLSAVVGGQFVSRSREPNYLSLMANYPVTRIDIYANSDLIESAARILHDPRSMSASNNNARFSAGFLNTFFGGRALIHDQFDSDSAEERICSIQ